MGPFPQMKTYLAKKETVQPKWYLIDAEGKVLGRWSMRGAARSGRSGFLVNIERIPSKTHTSATPERAASSGLDEKCRWPSMATVPTKVHERRSLSYARRLKTGQDDARLA